MKNKLQKIIFGLSAVLATSTVSAQCPVISCPGDITVNVDPGVCGAAVNYATPIGTDACIGTLGNFLFVSDNAGGTEIPAALLAEGYTVTSVFSDCIGGDNATLQGSLASYDAVFWHAVGANGYGETHNAATFTNLTSYVTGGGKIFVTGYDVIASPTDALLISFLGGTTSTDSGASSGNALIGSNSLTTGHTNIVGTTFTAPNGDHDDLNGLAGSVNVVLTGTSSGAEWCINTIGAGEAAWVSSGQSGTNTMVAWSTPGSGYHEALLNFAATHGGCSAGPSTSMTAGLADGSVFPVGVTVVTYETVDCHGNNPASCSFNVTVVDNESPVADAVSLLDITASCEIVSLTAPTATDNCTAVVTVTNDVTLPIIAQGTTVVTWTYDDGNGNTSTQMQNVILADILAPVADVASLLDVTAECEITSLTAPTATDNCGAVTVTNDATLPISTQGTTVVTWTYDDGNGNTSTQTQNVILTDVLAPVADLVSLLDITASCEVTSLTAPTATDNCGTVTVTNDATLPISTQGTTVVTWTYDDGNGNTSTQAQNVILTDVTAPVADLVSLLDVTASCEVVSLTDPTATDDCSGLVTVTNDAVLPISTQDTTIVTWTYTDANGNSSTQIQNIILTDTIAPVADLAVLLDVTSVCEVASLTAPTATDNCAGSVTVTNDAVLPITTQATTVVTWTYTDVNGNSSTQTQNVIVSAIDVNVTVTGTLLSSDAVSGTYQWLDCDNGNAIVVGETNQTFTPTTTGNYAVEVTEGSCVDTSSCYLVDYTGVEELTSESILIYPNPSNTGDVNIQFEGVISQITLFDMSGRTIGVPTNIEEGTFDVSNLESGKYLIQVILNDKSITKQVVVQ
jgi:hypothetical protein